MNQSRRRFAGGLALLGAGTTLGLWSPPAAAEPPPETTKIRLLRSNSVCDITHRFVETNGACASTSPSKARR